MTCMKTVDCTAQDKFGFPNTERKLSCNNMGRLPPWQVSRTQLGSTHISKVISFLHGYVIHRICQTPNMTSTSEDLLWVGAVFGNAEAGATELEIDIAEYHKPLPKYQGQKDWVDIKRPTTSKDWRSTLKKSKAEQKPWHNIAAIRTERVLKQAKIKS